MTTDRNQGLGVPVSVLTVVALFVSASIFSPKPFETLRPAEPETFRYDVVDDQDVDARLWQDPFTAVARHAREHGLEKGPPVSDPTSCDRRDSVAAAAERDPHSVCRFRTRLTDGFAPRGQTETTASESTKRRLQVLGVLVPGNPFVGAGEGRRKARYALLAGMNAAGFEPDESEHIGFFAVGVPPVLEPKESAQQIVRVPYELFNPRDSSRAERVLVLWLDEAALGSRWLIKLAYLLSGVMPVCKPGPPEACRIDATLPALSIIGPSTSDALNAAADQSGALSELGKRKDHYGLAARWLLASTFYSPFATAADARLPASGKPRIFRTITTDDRLMNTVAAELQARGVDPCNEEGQRIAVVAEWDTFYGRELGSSLEKALGGGKDGVDKRCPELLRYSYLRGLDGVAVGDRKPNGEAEQANKRERNSDAIEWPEGHDQRDYLRRLAARIRDDLKETRDRLAAVGVLGSEVHDKLIVLQALRQEFPGVVFFTTDLDARLLHPKVSRWARNTIVASAFDLTLHRTLQADIPPFRDVYQTAMFFAVQLALHERVPQTNSAFAQWFKERQEKPPLSATPDALEKWLGTPRLFEVGRHTRIGLNLDNGRSGSVHPPVRPLTPGGPAVWIAALLLIGGVVVLVLGRPGTPSLRALWRGSTFGSAAQSPPFRTCVIVFATLELLALAFVCAVVVSIPLERPLHASQALFWAAFGACVIAAAAGTRHILQGRGDRGAGAAPRPPAPGASLWVIGILGGLALAAAPFAIAAESGSIASRVIEPFSLTEGVSAWPTEIARAGVLLLTIVFIDQAWFGTIENGDRLTRTFFRREPVALFRASRRFWRLATHARPRWGRVAEITVWYLEPDRFMKGPRTDGLRAVRGMLLWGEYLRRSQGWRRAVRVAFWSVLTVGAGMVLFHLLRSDDPHPPARGAENISLLSWTLGAAVVALIVLLVSVADATVLCRKFVRLLQEGRTSYPLATLKHFATRLGTQAPDLWIRRLPACIPDRVDERNRGRLNTLLDDWIDIQLVAARTAQVGRLIYAPFLILALLIVARSPVFDNWPLPPALAILFTAYFAWAVLLAVLLQTTAARARKTALRRMEADLLWLKGSGPELQKLADQFGRMTDEVRNAREGAFVPFFEQPAVTAILMPLGGVGGIELLEHVVLAPR